MTEKITKEVKKSGNSGHVIVPKDWIGNEVTVIKKTEFTEKDARKSVGHLCELLDNGHGVEEAIKLMDKYSDLHYSDFNTTPFERLNQRVPPTDNQKLDKYSNQILKLLDREKQKQDANQYKIEVYKFLRQYIVKGVSMELAINNFLGNLQQHSTS